MYLKEEKLSPDKVFPRPNEVELNQCFRFVDGTLCNDSLWHHHIHSQFRESIPDKVRKDPKMFHNFVRNLSINFPDLEKVGGKTQSSKAQRILNSALRFLR